MQSPTAINAIRSLHHIDSPELHSSALAATAKNIRTQGTQATSPQAFLWIAASVTAWPPCNGREDLIMPRQDFRSPARITGLCALIAMRAESSCSFRQNVTVAILKISPRRRSPLMLQPESAINVRHAIQRSFGNLRHSSIRRPHFRSRVLIRRCSANPATSMATIPLPTQVATPVINRIMHPHKTQITQAATLAMIV